MEKLFPAGYPTRNLVWFAAKIGNPIREHCDPLHARAEFKRETREKITLISHHTDMKIHCNRVNKA